LPVTESVPLIGSVGISSAALGAAWRFGRIYAAADDFADACGVAQKKPVELAAREHRSLQLDKLPFAADSYAAAKTRPVMDMSGNRSLPLRLDELFCVAVAVAQLGGDDDGVTNAAVLLEPEPNV
jgi:hypothetical protein